MAIKRSITIGNQVVQATEEELRQSDLLFYPENPRVYNTLHAEHGDNPPQSVIESHMKQQEHVKILKLSIEANGGLLEPIIVRRKIVLEGNSRLAAYRILAAKDPIKWGKIKANVLPDDTPDELVDALLGTLHVIGKTPWSPFEQASFLSRSISRTRKPIDALADELGLTKASAQAFIRVYQTMIENDDAIPAKWSYYFELDKNKDIRNADENEPHREIKIKVLDMIKENKVPKAQDIRTIGKVVNARSENGREAAEDLLSGEITIEQAAIQTDEETKLNSIKSRSEAFLSFVKKERKNIHDNREDAALIFTIKQIIQQLESSIK